MIRFLMPSRNGFKIVFILLAATAAFVLVYHESLVRSSKDVVTPVVMEGAGSPTAPKSVPKQERGVAVAPSEHTARAAQAPPVLPEIACKLHVRVFSRNGDLVKSAEITCARDRRQEDVAKKEDAISALTDEKGDAVLDIPSPGHDLFAVCAVSEEQVGYLQTIFGPAESFVHVDIILQSARTLRGKTVTTSGDAVPGVLLTCFPANPDLLGAPVQPIVRSDLEGNFEFSLLPAKPYIVRGDIPEYAPSVSEAVVPDGPPVVLVMNKGGSLVAITKDSVTGRPVADLGVTLRMKATKSVKFQGRSNQDGMISIEGITQGTYEMYSVSDAFALAPPRPTVTIALGKTTRIELVVEGAGSISGMVVDAATGIGIADTHVSASSEDIPGSGKRAFTDQAGAFSILGLPSGDYGLRIQGAPPIYGPPRRIAAKRTISLHAGEHLEDVVFELSSGLTLSGRVLYEDGLAAAGATVDARAMDPTNRVALWTQSAISNSDGYFVLANCTDEHPFFMQATLKPRRSAEVGPLIAAAPDIGEVVLTLNDVKTSSIAGQVVDEKGSSVSANVTALLLDNANDTLPQQYSMSTDGEGYFLFPEVPVGEYEFSLGVSTEGLIQMVETAGTETLHEDHPIRDLRLVMHSGGLTISGTVVDSLGEPAMHRFIEAERQTEGESASEQEPFVLLETMTDSNGAFVFRNVEEGRYRLRNRSDEPEKWRLDVNAGDEVHIVLPPKTPRPEQQNP